MDSSSKRPRLIEAQNGERSPKKRGREGHGQGHQQGILTRTKGYQQPFKLTGMLSGADYPPGLDGRCGGLGDGTSDQVSTQPKTETSVKQ